ncbi:MAG: signal peptidase I [Candidatus Omnitrophica bacterium]|nr:signal peptidase I [Candidatus Omnitrophota bacterium]MDD5238197.1 signal peptidase I [Candidatus Omnitrophota bacterium]
MAITKENLYQIKDKITIALVRQALDERKTVWFAMQGSSMRPILKDGDFLEIRKLRQEDFRRGDIVAFQKDDSSICIIIHRLVKKENNFFLTKGDAVIGMDCPIDFNKILGKVINIKRNGKIVCLNNSYRIYGFITSYLRLPWFYFTFKKNIRTPQLIPLKIFRILIFLTKRQSKLNAKFI